MRFKCSSHDHEGSVRDSVPWSKTTRVQRMSVVFDHGTDHKHIHSGCGVMIGVPQLKIGTCCCLLSTVIVRLCTERFLAKQEK